MQTFEALKGFREPFELIRALVEHSPVGVQVFDADGRSIYVNEQHGKMYGPPPPANYSVLRDEHAEGAGLLPLIKKAFAGESIKLPLFWYDVRELKRGLDSSERELLRTAGKRCATETFLTPVFDSAGQVTHVAAYHRDVTGEMFMQQERERALKERDDARALIQNVLDQTKAVVFIKDLDGKLVFANAQFCRIFGKDLDQMLGKGEYELYPKEIADRYRENDRRVLETLSHVEAEETAVHSDGTVHTYLSLKFPLRDSSGELFGICGISTEITQFRKVERELEAARRIQSIGLLAGGVAHNFNNLLGIIVLIADTMLIRAEESPEERRRSLESLKSAAQKASFLTKQLLAFGRRQEIQPCILDLGTTVSGMKEILGFALREDIRLSVDVGFSIWPIHSDPLQVEQVLTNLCLNARDAMTKGGALEISVRNTTLSPESRKWRIGRPSGDFVELRVSDNGTGMSPETLEHIFEPFFTTKKEGQGTGLGLATVYGIVQKAGGDIAVESTAGKGTIFHVCFPKVSGFVSWTKQEPRAQGAPSRHDEVILLVEDEGTLRHITASLLRDRGYTVIEARDGKVALDLWPMIAARVDLIMTDVVMPDMNGVDLVRELSGKTSRPPKVLFISAYSEKLSERRFDQVELLEKPYSAFDLFKKLRELFDTENG